MSSLAIKKICLKSRQNDKLSRRADSSSTIENFWRGSFLTELHLFLKIFTEFWEMETTNAYKMWNFGHLWYLSWERLGCFFSEPMYIQEHQMKNVIYQKQKQINLSTLMPEFSNLLQKFFNIFQHAIQILLLLSSGCG